MKATFDMAIASSTLGTILCFMSIPFVLEGYWVAWGVLLTAGVLLAVWPIPYDACYGLEL